MRLEPLATIGYQRPANLVHVVLDNQAHESTGGQATVSHSLDICGIAAACGYPCVARAATPAAVLAGQLQTAGGERLLLHVPILTGVTEPLPRPAIEPPAVAQRLRDYLQGTRRDRASGPAEPWPRGEAPTARPCRRALAATDECHRETEFARLTLELRRRLLAVYPQAQATFEAVLLSGSGTTAVESTPPARRRRSARPW